MASTRTQAEELVDDVTHGAAAEHARRSLAEARACAEQLAAKGSEALHEGSDRARKALNRASEETAQYVHDQPLKSLLIAAATGAALALLVSAVAKR